SVDTLPGDSFYLSVPGGSSKKRLTALSTEWSILQVRPRTKRLLLKFMPSAMSAYLRQERAQWADEVRRHRRSTTSAVRSRALVKALSQPVETSSIVWESFSGNGALCNPEALFRRMINDSEYSEYRHTWVLSAQSWNSPFHVEFRRHPRVSFV